LQLASDGGCDPPVSLCCLDVAGMKEGYGCTVSILTLRRVRLAELIAVPRKEDPAAAVSVFARAGFFAGARHDLVAEPEQFICKAVDAGRSTPTLLQRNQGRPVPKLNRG
jgi:hypothetical protein